MARMQRWHAALLGLGVLAGAGFGLHRANRLPRRKARRTPAPSVAGETTLSRVARERSAHHPGLSGLHLLADGVDAFAARYLLARAAERTLDLQYYIWHGDRTGTLLLEAVHEAAQRGVRVRLLLDDNGIAGLDRILAALNDHPNIEVRIFNPFRIRYPKAIGFLVDFGRLNRRMHNKSFTVDGAVSIVGGRNVGDEYFGAGDGALFADLDVMAMGPVAREVEADFERYWTSESAYPARQILPILGRAQRRKLTSRASVVERDLSARRYVERLASLPIVHEAAQGTLALEWAAVRMISDDPAKVVRELDYADLLAGKLDDAIGRPTRELAIVSGYFVPGEQGTRQLSDYARDGVRVSVLTNGYSATDVALVHAGYAPWRKPLLSAGVRLFETAAAVRDTPSKKERRKGSRLGIGSNLRPTGSGSFAALRSGASTIHAKTITADRERLFVGSFNFDPRSMRLNTEMGFVIDSPVLAAQVADAFETLIPGAAYEVTLDPRGRLHWTCEGRSSTREPGLGLFDSLLVGIGERLPIGWLL
ncbi:phospholipase D family protein [Novosphingobium resinovorum]|uniref:phospholipase D family protein n=1 Tax=Novosphingobium resinovorum TaxID=158500 RepID=UPI002ED08630|nr:phospholipase D family protein [Novosphingobium resinovorum]